MKCGRCFKSKDGLIYITNLIDYAHSSLNQKLRSCIEEFHLQRKEDTES